jgi:hypothetical protein
MQRLGGNEAIIHKCLAHTPKGEHSGNSTKLARIYMRHDYETQICDAWNRLGAHLEQVMAAGNAISMSFSLAKAA